MLPLINLECITTGDSKGIVRALENSNRVPTCPACKALDESSISFAKEATVLLRLKMTPLYTQIDAIVSIMQQMEKSVCEQQAKKHEKEMLLHLSHTRSILSKCELFAKSFIDMDVQAVKYKDSMLVIQEQLACLLQNSTISSAAVSLELNSLLHKIHTLLAKNELSFKNVMLTLLFMIAAVELFQTLQTFSEQ
jgi:hypothetical protein